MSNILFIFNNNSSILEEYKKQYQRFFARPNVIVIIYCSSEDLVSHAQETFPKATIKCYEFCSNACTSFLHFLSTLSSGNVKFKFIYKIETKSKNIKFGEVGQVMLNWRLIEDKLDESQPMLCGSNDCRTENNKLFLREQVVSILQKNHMDPNNLLYSFVDKYAFDISNEKLKEVFQVDPDFYSFYESDLRKGHFSREAAISHWQTYGCKEMHRVHHPFMVESYGKTNFYISGTNFCMNQSCVQLFVDNIKNWSDELTLASQNEAICASWEMLFGLVPYLYFGKVYGVENGIFHESHEHNNIFDPFIYKSVNSDLAQMTTIEELKNHFNENGWAEDRTFSVRFLQKPQNIFYNKNFDADLAFFLKYPIQNYASQNLKFLLSKGFKIDIYLDVWDKTVKYKGFILSPIEISNILADFVSLFNDFLHNCNICLGFGTYKSYKCGFVQEGIQGVEFVKKILNLKVLKFLNDQTLVDFIHEQIDA